MRLAFVVNDIATELSGFTTTRLALAAVNMGHESWHLGVGDFVYMPDGSIHAHARSVRGGGYECPDRFLKELRSPDARIERISIDDVDAMMLRNDPSLDAMERPWAQTTGVLFGQFAASKGVIVLNDPVSLASAINKTYFQHFPDQVRPTTCISRDRDELKSFIRERHDKVVIKPLQGSGGQNVFLINEGEKANLNQMIDAVIRDGYCIAQEYLPAAANGDVRLFVMNGKPLTQNGVYAAFRRVNETGDARSNMHSGGRGVQTELTDQMLQVAETVRPKLVRDGMFLAGLDLVDDKLMEINVFSPGGIGIIAGLTGVDFSVTIIEAIERKVRYREYFGSAIANVDIATL